MAIRIIDISDDVYKDIKAYNQIPCADNYTVTKAILNSEALPDNATKGEVIKILFQPYKVMEEDDNVDGLPYVIMYYDYFHYIKFRRSWWNAPYKEEDNGTTT